MIDHRFQLREEAVIAQGALTNSKRPSTFVQGVYPTHVIRGRGCYVYSADGQRYIDFICALGTNILGYANLHVNTAVRNRLDQGNLFSLSTTAEIDFGELVQSFLPFVERIKVLKSGSEGCSAAVRISRAYTNNAYVFSQDYHGWHDAFTNLTPPAHGVFEYAPTLKPLSEMDNWIEDNGTCVAAVIIEPVNLDWSNERVEYLRELRQRCTSLGALLIYDETITGLRFPGLSVAKWSGVYPDLIIMGKALANGLPISIVGGKKEVMDSDYFVSSTYAGDTLPMAAAAVVVPAMKERIDQMWERAGMFQKSFNDIGGELISIKGYPTRGVIQGRDDLTKALFMQECCKAGVLFGPSFFWCEPHAAESAFVLDVVGQVVSRIKTGVVQLEGAMPRKPFAQVQREKNA